MVEIFYRYMASKSMSHHLIAGIVLRIHPTARLLAMVLLMLAPFSSQAGVAKISSPEVTKDRYDIEYIGIREGDSNPARTNNQRHRLETNYGITDDFLFGVEVNGRRNASHSFEGSSVAARVRYQLTQQGEWWLSSAVDLKYTAATHGSDADRLSSQLLLLRRLGPLRVIFNGELVKEIGENRDSGVSFDYQFQGLYSLGPKLAIGAEWQVDYGTDSLSDFADVEHYIGPVATATVFEEGGVRINSLASYNIGLTKAATDDAARIQLVFIRQF